MTDTPADQDAAEAPGFADLGLSDSLVAELTSVGYNKPTPIQAGAIPALLEGRDLVGQAQTGTGKTAAFALPMLERLNRAPGGSQRPPVRGLVLAPTRELATQVCQSIHGYAQGIERRGPALRVLAVFGGAPIGRQLSRLERGVDIVVGTPGRVMDCIRRGALDLSEVEVVVLDEADEMLRMGFFEDVTWILDHVPEARQTVLFSATMPPEIRRVAQQKLNDPVTVAIEGGARTADDVEQRVLFVSPRDKVNALTRILEVSASDAVLVFARTQVRCSELAEELLAAGFEAAPLHGGMPQAQRDDVMRRLEHRRINVVVATDVAARGLHVEGITHVINFDPPVEAETYVHRIGRTGRAGKKGMSVLLLTWNQRAFRERIERYTRKRMIEVDPPTAQDLATNRIERFKTAVKARLTAEEAELAVYRSVVEELVAEAESDPATIATALAHLACTGQPLTKPAEPETARAPRQERRPEPDRRPQRDDRHRPQGPRDRAPQPDRGDDRPRHRGTGDQRRPARAADRPRLFVSLGGIHGLRPGDLVGAVANEADVPGAAIGPIDIREKFSFFGIEPEFYDRVLQRMESTSIRGKRAFIRPAHQPRGSGEAPRGGPRPSQSDRAPAPRRDDRPSPQQKTEAAPTTERDAAPEKAVPAAKKPKPAAKKPKPAAKKSKPAARKAKSAAKKPKPAAKKAKPAAKRPKAAAKRPKPAAKKPKPAAKKPAGGGHQPPTRQPKAND